MQKGSIGHLPQVACFKGGYDFWWKVMAKHEVKSGANVGLGLFTRPLVEPKLRIVKMIMTTTLNLNIISCGTLQWLLR